MYNKSNILKAAKAFGLVRVTDLKVLSDGLMHKTFKLETVAGTYILQQLHPLLSSVETVRDFMHVTEHLRDRSFFAPLCLRTPRGDVMFRDEDCAYRVYTYVPGQTVTVAPDANRVREAGKIVGKFHQAMQDFSGTFESSLILHDTREIHTKLSEILMSNSAIVTEEIKEMSAFILESLAIHYLPNTLPLRPAHGDLKISNLLFNEKGEAVSLIDFDTCNRMMLPIELGDAFRSWCSDAEDDASNTFSLERFQAGWEAYEAESEFILAEERQYVVQGILLITLELAARFMTDYFKDSYFGWDENRYASRRAHNLARSRGQIALYKSLLLQREAAEKIVRNA